VKPIGDITRGTTNPNRLRRADRWFIHTMCSYLRSVDDPVCVDLGFGRTPDTTIEWHDRLRHHVRDDITIVGVEIDRDRVAEASSAATAGLIFVHGGFEVPLPDTRTGGQLGVRHERAHAIRAFNVLRQYSESDVRPAWDVMAARLAPGGLLVDGTCDEIGRVCAWIAVRHDGHAAVPQSLTFATHVGSLDTPLAWAERLPKALIHRNIPGEPVHAFLTAADRAWASVAGIGVFGPRQRFIAMAQRLKDDGWPIADTSARWRLGELTIAWSAVAPSS
jgi:hypothetical protein